MPFDKIPNCSNNNVSGPSPVTPKSNSSSQIATVDADARAKIMCSSNDAAADDEEAIALPENEIKIASSNHRNAETTAGAINRSAVVSFPARNDIAGYATASSSFSSNSRSHSTDMPKDPLTAATTSTSWLSLSSPTSRKRQLPSSKRLSNKKISSSETISSDQNADDESLTVEEHRAFVSAIFDVGLVESSPVSLFDNMSQGIKEKYSALNLEKIKSKLQKYRKFRVKNKADFMAAYDKTLKDYLEAHPVQSKDSTTMDKETSSATDQQGCRRRPSSAAAKLHTSGEIAAHLAYSVLAGGTMEDEQRQEGGRDKKPPNQSKETMATKPATASSQERGSFSSLSTWPESAQYPPNQKSSQQVPGISNQIETLIGHPGEFLEMPVMTEKEKNSDIGRSFQYFMGLYSCLNNDIQRQRKENDLRKNSSVSPEATSSATNSSPEEITTVARSDPSLEPDSNIGTGAPPAASTTNNPGMPEPIAMAALLASRMAENLETPPIDAAAIPTDLFQPSVSSATYESTNGTSAAMNTTREEYDFSNSAQRSSTQHYDHTLGPLEFAPSSSRNPVGVGTPQGQMLQSRIVDNANDSESASNDFSNIGPSSRSDRPMQPPQQQRATSPISGGNIEQDLEDKKQHYQY